MSHRSFVSVVVLLVSVVLGRPSAAAEPTLERDVLPILTKNCMGCHGGLKREAELDLRTPAAMKAGGENGPAVVPGDVAGSPLWKRIAADEMPPGEAKLSAEDKATLRAWIAAGMPAIADRARSGAGGLGLGRHEPAVVAKAIDTLVERALDERGLTPAGLSDDAEFLRRVTLDLTGRIPTAERAAAFLDDTAPDKRAKLIDELLASPEYGEHFGRTWRDWIAPPELPSDANGGKQPHDQTRALGRWMGERFAAGESWDAIVRRVLTVQGGIKENPQVIFFGLAGQQGKATADGTARAVGSLFMGVQLQCARCHDDPYRDWSQTDHWSLAAFFSETTGDFGKVEEKPGKGGDRGRITIPRDAFVNAGEKVPVAFPHDEPLDAATRGRLRNEFVDWLTARENPFFARAFANRLWFQLFARGLVDPVDDIRPLNPPTHPELLAMLEREFAASGYDVRHLVRCLCNSRTYQRTGRVKPGTPAETVTATTRAFGRMPLRVMTADQLLDSLKLAHADPKLDLRAIDPDDGNTNGESAPVGDAYLEFLRRFGTNEDDTTDFTHGIPQMLTMINHPRLLRAGRDLETELKRRVESSTPAETVAWLYLATLSRRPTDAESADAVAYVESATDPAAAYVGVLWTLVNRSEFLFVR